MAEKGILVNTALMPAYYQDFRCIMGACQDNCCDAGWRIDFSRKDYLAVKRAPKSAELEALMPQSMRRLRGEAGDDKYAEFRLNAEGRCAFHSPEGLCRLQLECGAETLPQVCRVYPRRSKYTLSAQERSLSPSCEGVLALLWDLPQGVDFIEEPLPEREWRELIPLSPAAERFSDIRALWIDVLQERSLSLPQRLVLLGLLTQQLQGLEWEDAAAVERWLRQGEAMRQEAAAARQLDQLPRNQRMFISNGLRLIAALEYSGKRGLAQELTDAVVSGRLHADVKRVSFHQAHYQALEAKLEELLGHSEYFFENLLVTVVFHTSFPDVSAPEKLWKSYMSLCNLYSYYRFAAVCAMDRGATRERLFHVLVQVSRTILHSNQREASLRDEFFQNDSATLAHMAILVGG